MTAGSVLAFLVLLWRRYSTTRSLKTAVGALKEAQTDQGQALDNLMMDLASLKAITPNRDEMSHNFERLFDKLDENKSHYDERFAETNRRIDLILQGK